MQFRNCRRDAVSLRSCGGRAMETGEATAAPNFRASCRHLAAVAGRHARWVPGTVRAWVFFGCSKRSETLRRDIVRSGALLCVATATSLVPSLCLAQGGFSADEGWTLVRSLSSAGDASATIDVEVDPAVYEMMAGTSRVVVKGFPLPGRAAVDLDLERFEILSHGARLVVVDESGERAVARPGMQSFRGIVRGDPSSLVVLSLFDGRIAGSLQTQMQEYVVDPRSFQPESPPSSVEIRNADSDPDRPEVPICAAELPEKPLAPPAPPGMGPPPTPAIDGSTTLTAAIAIDTTYEWYAHFGSEAAAQNYVLNLMAQVSAIYEAEVNVRLEVPYLRIFTTSQDPYTDGTTSTGTLLNELNLEWNTHQTAIDRTAVHLLSVRPSGGAGLAYLDVLCHHSYHPGSSFDFGVSTMSAQNGSWEKDLVAHELGHNFASPHTHCYVPEIDRCAVAPGCYEGEIILTVGTIMSYCPASDTVFHQRVEDETIRPAAEAAYPTCMTTDQAADPPLPPQDLTLF
jgi:hypothetical protein